MRLPEEQELDLQLKKLKLDIAKVLAGLITLIFFHTIGATIVFIGWALMKLFH